MVHAPEHPVAGVCGAGVGVITVRRLASDTSPILALLCRGARVSILTGHLDRGVRAPDVGGADVFRAWVFIVARDHNPSGADPLIAEVIAGAWVRVVAAQAIGSRLSDAQTREEVTASLHTHGELSDRVCAALVAFTCFDRHLCVRRDHVRGCRGVGLRAGVICRDRRLTRARHKE